MKVICRIWIDGNLTVQQEHDTHTVNLAELQREHEQTIRQTAGGRPWLIELEMVGLPEDQRFLRFGTDADGMVQPTDLSALHQHPWSHG